MNNILLCCFAICVSMSQLMAQDSCAFFMYKTLYYFSDGLSADKFESVMAEEGMRSLYIRINDTVFTDFYKLSLKVNKKNRIWYTNLTQYMEPCSCELIKENIIQDGRLTYRQISIDSTEKVFSHGNSFQIIKRSDSIYYKLDEGSLLLRYLLNGDTVNSSKNMLNEDLWIGTTVRTQYLRSEPCLVFGRKMDSLVFKEIYASYEKIIWYIESDMIPIKIRVQYHGEAGYEETILIGAFQF